MKFGQGIPMGAVMGRFLRLILSDASPDDLVENDVEVGFDVDLFNSRSRSQDW